MALKSDRTLEKKRLMSTLNEQELINALAAWVGKIKNPYDRSQPAIRQIPVTLKSCSPNAWMEIRETRKNRLEISCIHRIVEYNEANRLEDIRRECNQFNSLMEKVRLPVYVWEDKAKSEFQLRWQETMHAPSDLQHVQRFFEQSLYLANALQSRLGWALGSSTQPVSH